MLVNTAISAFIPVIVLIAYSLKSKRTVEPIILAVTLAYFLKYGKAFPNHFMEGIYQTLSNKTIVFLIVMLTLFGGLIELITFSKGILGLVEFFDKRIQSKKAALLLTWLLGLSLFMDDYLNSLLVGTSMRSITDNLQIPREQVSIISITTSVPLSIMTPVSTWAVFIFGVLSTSKLDTSLGQVGTHLKIMPYLIYPIISIIGTGLMILGITPKVFKLKEAYKAFKSKPLNLEEITKGNPLNFALPIGIMILVTLITLNITYSLILALLITMIWLSLTRQVKFRSSVDVILRGMSTMTSPLIFIIFAFSFGEILTELGFSGTVLSIIQPLVSQDNLLIFSFLLVSVLVFSGIDVWAAIPLILPILLPLAQVYDVNPLIVIGAILSGISFGTQVCFISESNILVSDTLGLKPVNQVLALLPYALLYAFITSIIFIYIGYSL